MNFYFLIIKETEILFKIFDKYNIEARFVGGCVRDALTNCISYDFDIAVNYNITELHKILKQHNINIIKIVTKYLFMTVIINNIKFEITSLRQDFNCRGRECDVKLISSFEIDAHRRDFTINAIYIDINGNIFDYFNGINDLKKGIIKFIGDPLVRIKEDYLRIFRYFRFCAKYNDLSNRYADIIRSEAININKLPISIIKKEMFKIINIPNNFKILQNMVELKLINKSYLENYKNS